MVRYTLKISLVILIVLNLVSVWFLLEWRSKAEGLRKEASQNGFVVGIELANRDIAAGVPRRMKVQSVAAYNRAKNTFENTTELEYGLPVCVWHTVNFGKSSGFAEMFLHGYNTTVDEWRRSK